MQDDKTYRVIVSAPEESARRLAVEVFDRFNRREAGYRGVRYVLLTELDATPSAHYFVRVPSTDGSTADAAAWREAKRLASSSDAPMRSVVALFHSLPAERLAEPEPGVARCLQLRSELETEGSPYYALYDDPDELRALFERLLADWLLSHEQGVDVSRESDPVAFGQGLELGVRIASCPPPSGDSVRDGAWTDFRAGRFVAAELALAAAMPGPNPSPEAAADGARLSLLMGRVRTAEARSLELIDRLAAELADGDARHGSGRQRRRAYRPKRATKAAGAGARWQELRDRVAAELGVGDAAGGSRGERRGEDRPRVERVAARAREARNSGRGFSQLHSRDRVPAGG